MLQNALLQMHMPNKKHQRHQARGDCAAAVCYCRCLCTPEALALLSAETAQSDQAPTVEPPWRQRLKRLLNWAWNSQRLQHSRGLGNTTITPFPDMRSASVPS